MKNMIFLLLVFLGAAALFFWLYLDKYATKADVYTREKSYGIELPLWMKDIPQTTWEVQDLYAEGRAVLTGEIAELKTSAQVEFNSRLEELKNDLKEQAKEQTNSRIDSQFGGSKTNTGN